MHKGNILIVGLSFAIFACRPPHKNSVADAPYTKSIDESDVLDSAIAIGFKNIDRKNFSHEFEITVDSGRRIKATLSVGEFFGNRKYIIIKRATPVWNGIIPSEPVHAINIVLLKPRHEIKSLAAQAEDLKNFVNDTIQDINGDGKKDFIANYRSTLWHVNSRYVMVDLLMNDSTFVSRSYVFTNPSFSIKENVIRGVLHGDAGGTEIYKYRWNGIEIDTIEYIYHDYRVKGQFIKSRYLPHDKRNNEKEKINLKSLPEEYLNLPELKWFMGNEK
jgi:hypothetical protein